MAKRRHGEEFEIPFVALMDTMTNVVGVLIIVLVMVGLGVSTAVKKILSDLPPVDESTYQQLKALMEKRAHRPIRICSTRTPPKPRNSSPSCPTS